MGPRARRVMAAMAFGVFVSITCLLGSGGGATAAAPDPIVLGSCATSVQGVPGQPVSLSPQAVTGIVTDAVRAVPVLGPPAAEGVAATLASLPPIPIGTVGTGTGQISGATIATAVIAALPALAPVLADAVRASLTSACEVVVQSVNTATAPKGDGSVPGSPGQAPGGQTNPGPAAPPAAQSPPAAGTASTPTVLGGAPPNRLTLYDPRLWTARSPMADYSSIPFASPGSYAPSPAVRYGGSVPGYNPGFGLPDTDTEIHKAGRAEALGLPGSDQVAVPMLLAVLALSGVTAALVRVWVLRRAVGR